jgi:uncharacterized protein
MQCHVYASVRRQDTYLWLDDPQRIDTLPETLHELLGELRFVIELDLQPDRSLPREDAGLVLENLRTQGWHLQLPPGEATD